MATEQTKYPRLLDSTGSPADGVLLAIPPTGLVLTLELPQVPDAVQELASTSLVVTVPPQETDLISQLPGTVITTDQGPINPEALASVQWLTVDWGSRRPLTFLNLATQGGSQSAADLKVADGGGWFPPYPSDKITINADQRIPAVIATRLMVELEASDAVATGIAVRSGNQLQDLSISIADQGPVFQQPGPLHPGQQVNVEHELVQAVNLALAANPSQNTVPLTIRSSVQGEVLLTFDGTIATVKRSLDGQPGTSTSVKLPWDQEATRTVAVPEGSQLQSVEFSVAVDLIAERVHIRPVSLDALQSQLCDARFTSAQGFAPLPAGVPLVGLDLFLRPMTQTLAGSLAIHPDVLGRPRGEPLPGAVVEITWEGDTASLGIPQWVPGQFPEPVTISQAPWWAVLSITQGEAFWPLSTPVPEGALGAAYRAGAGAWTQRKSAAAPDGTWAISRLRVVNPVSSAPRVYLRRGQSERVEVSTDQQGRAVLDRAGLDTLNAPGAIESGQLDLIIVSDVAGELTLSDVLIRFVPGQL